MNIAHHGQWKFIFRAPYDRDIELSVRDGIETHVVALRKVGSMLSTKFFSQIRRKAVCWREQRTGR